jgi:type VI secretion system protein ImpI
LGAQPGKPGGAPIVDRSDGVTRPEPALPGREDPLLRQVAPYVEAYRASWEALYLVVYEHLGRLPPDLRARYVVRLGAEHPSVWLEDDFQKVARYYGVDPRLLAEQSPPLAALALLRELSRALVPRAPPPGDVSAMATFVARVRSTLDILLTGFCLLRDASEAGAFDRDPAGDPSVVSAADARELASLLVGPTARPEALQELADALAGVILRHERAPGPR